MQNAKSIIFFFPGNFVSRHSFPRGQSILSLAASSYCALLRPNARAKLANEDARCFSYRAKWWQHEGKPREEKKKAREVEPKIP
jgi:hypothetical protein